MIAYSQEDTTLIRQSIPLLVQGTFILLLKELFPLLICYQIIFLLLNFFVVSFFLLFNQKKILLEDESKFDIIFCCKIKNKIHWIWWDLFFLFIDFYNLAYLAAIVVATMAWLTHLFFNWWYKTESLNSPLSRIANFLIFLSSQ